MSSSREPNRPSEAKGLGTDGKIAGDARGAGGPLNVARGTGGGFRASDALLGVRGDIFDIQRYAVHDGPGIRTLVFLKGCPLSCLWCQNPEGKKRGPELLFYVSRCLRCGRCVEACPRGAVTAPPGGTPDTDRSRCGGCGLCARICPGDARKLAGKAVTAEEVLREAESDAVFYRRGGGGVTLSGGEPLTQPVFVCALLDLCRGRGIHTAVETCGYADTDTMEEVVSRADLILYDLKHMEPEEHRRATGVGNELILENARRISEMGKQLVFRFPLIPGVNDTPGNVAATAAFAAALPGVTKVEILPYHRLGASKYEAMGSRYPLAGAAVHGAASILRVLETMKGCGVDCAVEGFVEGDSG